MLRIKNKISTPSHPWQRERIAQEVELIKKFGLRRKREIWRLNYIINSFKEQAKRLVAGISEQAIFEKQKLFDRLKRLNLLSGDVSFDDVLALTVEDLLERRLQTFVYRKGLARSLKQARQMIVHGHISVGGKVITSPSYLVKARDENVIGYVETSPFSNPDHPELNINLGTKLESLDSENDDERNKLSSKNSKMHDQKIQNKKD